MVGTQAEQTRNVNLETAHQAQVLFNRDVELAEDISDDKNGDLLIGRNNYWSNLILTPSVE